ncbi:MAG: AMP-binding protein, partial [Cellulomonadaceae bacterium]|nr:AMP-binding protein [Cellulomonadaceae bacterium]
GVDPARTAQMRSAGLWGDASLLDFWRLAARAAPDKEAVKDSRGTSLTYRQVDERAARLATYLRGSGVAPGDVVSIQLPSWAEFLCLDIACLMIGAVVNPVLTSHRRAELSQILERCGTSVLVVPTHFRSTTYAPMAAALAAERPGLTVLAVEHDGVAAEGLDSLHDVLATTAPLRDEHVTPGRSADPAVVLFTSGSEARAKGVLLSHDNVIASERAFAAELGIAFDDRVFMPAPLAHATGYLHGMTLPFMVGATSVLLDVPRGDAALAMINAERCTCGMAAASVVTCLLDASDREAEPLSPTLRFLACGGSPVPRQLARRARDHGVRLHSVYGSTESAPHTLTTADDPDERVLTTDGRPVRGTEVKVVDPVTRVEVAPGVEGEEASRGPAVFLGYLGDPELTAQVLDADGWYYSGDLCTRDADGYIRITGRKKDMIIRGGENISAVEVEGVVRDHPGVVDVAVVAMPNARLGECACAYVVLEPGAEPPTLASLRELFGTRGLAKYKIPEWVEVIDALPMTPTGKVRKVELRERIAAQIRSVQAAPTR